MKLRPSILGATLSVKALLWWLTTLVLALSLRVVYPAAVLLLGRARSGTALILIAGSTLLAAGAGFASFRAIRAVRGLVYGALGEATRRYPMTAQDESKIESDISRGTPWVEVYVGRTLPTLTANLLAIPAVLLVAALHVGWQTALLVALCMSLGCALGVWGMRRAARDARAAWRDYQNVARLIEQGIRGRGELRVHGQGLEHQRALLDQVTRWSELDRKASMRATFSAWSIPVVTIALGYAISVALGGQPLELLTQLVQNPGRRALLGGILGLSSLPVLIGIARGLAAYASQRPHVEILEAFVANVDSSTPAGSETGTLGDIRFDQVEFSYAHDETPIKIHARLPQSGVIAFTGPNGSGKTTALTLLMGLATPTRGQVRVEFDERELDAYHLEGRVSYLSQHPYFDESATVRWNVQFTAPNASEAATVKLLQRFGVPVATLNRTFGTLSAGEQRSVALARVLLREADLYVLDEPEMNLSAVGRNALRALLQEERTERRLVMATHDADLTALADDVIAFDAGSFKNSGARSQREPNA